MVIYVTIGRYSPCYRHYWIYINPFIVVMFIEHEDLNLKQTNMAPWFSYTQIGTNCNVRARLRARFLCGASFSSQAFRATFKSYRTELIK